MCTFDDWAIVFCPEGKSSFVIVSILVCLILCVVVNVSNASFTEFMEIDLYWFAVFFEDLLINFDGFWT